MHKIRLPAHDASARPTLRHVAELSGVSEISVSRVMRNAPNVSSKLRAKVQAAAQQLGYTPNRVAGALASQSTALVAVILPSMSNSVFPEVLDGIDSVLSGTPYRAVLGMTHYDPIREEETIRDLLAWNPMGVVVAGFEHSPLARGLLEAFPNGVVEIMDADGTPIDISIGISHAAAGRAMAEHLLDRGRRRIGYIGAWGERPSRSAKRRQAFQEELARRGAPLQACSIQAAESSVTLGRTACAALLAEHPDLDAIFFANDDLAVGGLLHCLSAGIEVPGQPALAGFNGIPLIDAMPMRLTTIRTPRHAMGVRAAEALLQLLVNPQAAAMGKVAMPFDLLVGETT